MRFKKPFSLTIVDDNKKFIRLSKKILFNFSKITEILNFIFLRQKWLSIS